MLNHVLCLFFNTGFQLNGSLVLANSEEERKHLNELMKQGATNGVVRDFFISALFAAGYEFPIEISFHYHHFV
jgi:L-2-hydroxyglutarate oxidase LhgO